MSDNNKVTIDADYFAQLWNIANDADKVCEECVREKCGECNVVKERDELKAKLDVARDMSNDYESRLAAAERCIENIAKAMSRTHTEMRVDYVKIEEIIRAYRNAKEAAR